MSDTYSDLRYTNFPDQLDNQIPMRDPSVSDMVLINQYNSLLASGQYATAIEFMAANKTLQEAQMNAEKLLKIHHSILALERYFFDNVQEKIFKIGKKRGVWNAYMSSFSADKEYLLNKYDVVTYPVDGVYQYFLVYGDNIAEGEIPTESENYLQMSIKGDKGDKGDAGYTPKKDVDYRDGIDGVDGIGMSPKGAWANNRDYFQYDLVSHNGYLWYCLEDNIAKEPNNEPDIWAKFNISMQSAVGTDIPTNLEDGGIWMHLQDDGHIILKTKDESGQYVPMYPETYASYIKDATGKSLQRWIYQHYFERDDIKITFVDEDPVFTLTATLLSNPNIVVAKHTITDSVAVNGQKVHEFTAYDETGVYVMYRTKMVDTWNNNYNYHSVPEVII